MNTTEPKESLWRRFDRACFATPRDRRNMRRFTVLLAGWMLAYIASTTWLDSGGVGNTLGDVLIAVAPTIMGVVSLLAFARYLREADELARRIQYEALAFGFGAGVLFLFAYSSLEALGLPILSFPTAAAVMAGLWAVASVANAQRYA